jgi:hypothetical protein
MLFTKETIKKIQCYKHVLKDYFLLYKNQYLIKNLKFPPFICRIIYTKLHIQDIICLEDPHMYVHIINDNHAIKKSTLCLF